MSEPTLRPKRRRVPEPGIACGHPGCLHHISHPCEGCGRIGGRPPVCAQCAEDDHSMHDQSMYQLGCQEEGCHCTLSTQADEWKKRNMYG